MKILSSWLRAYLPALPDEIDDRRLAEDLTLRGIAVEGVHALASGHLFEMDITTNRVDAMNHYGIAREAATIYRLPLAELERGLPEARAGVGFPVRVEEGARGLCGRFTARVLRGVSIGASSGVVAEYFGLLGQKRISNAVDASNFVLMGMGHPTHAFDLDKIEGGIVVRLAVAGEKLRLLDGTERVLAGDDLVVADERKALGLAGVMGGWESMITAETRNVLVEAAWFDPAAVRRSARRHGLHTDASHRFERGADFAAGPVANDLVSGMILASGGWIDGEMVDWVDAWAEARTAGRGRVVLSVAEVRRHLGTTVAEGGITRNIVAGYLEGLGCRLEAAGEDEFAVGLPSWRLDLEREIDLIEEVARVYGYDRFANTLPSPLPVKAHPLAAKEAAVRDCLLGLGFSEALSTTFGSEAEASVFFSGTAVAMENPLSEEARMLRPSLVPGMLGMVGHNLNRDVREVRLFEQGTVFSGSHEAVVERAGLMVGMTGCSTTIRSGLYGGEEAPYFELKGAVEAVCGLFAGAGVGFTADGVPGWVEAGRGAVVTLGGERLGVVGELSRAEAGRRKLREAVWLAEIDLERLYGMPLRRALAGKLSRFQAVERDFSFTFADTVSWGEIEARLREVGPAEMVSLRPVEIFRDAKGVAVPVGHYALLLQAVFQSAERTLGEAELTEWWGLFLRTLVALGGELRGGKGLEDVLLAGVK